MDECEPLPAARKAVTSACMLGRIPAAYARYSHPRALRSSPNHGLLIVTGIYERA